MVISGNKITYALGISSGGLDSILSTLILKFQGIKIKWVSFETPFFSSKMVRHAAQEIGVSVYIINITEQYIKMIREKKCKFGKNLNPCIYCHALMFKIAGSVMRNGDFDFMFTGEVLGQRPMSQNKVSLCRIDKISGYEGYILRPLSARKLSKTIPEKNGLVNRTFLLDISGKSRKNQINLANKFGVDKYPSPAGGCLLTDKGFSIRFRDLLFYKKIYYENQIHLLKIGRHFRLDSRTKFIVCRNRLENLKIKKYIDFENELLMTIYNSPGSNVIMFGDITKKNVAIVTSVCAGYNAKRSKKNSVKVLVNLKGKLKFMLSFKFEICDIRFFMVY